MSSDLLFREVSTPSASSTESTPEVAWHPVNIRATEPVREMTSTLGRFNEEEEEEEVLVSCEDLQSALTVEESVRIARLYDLEVVLPYKLERLYTPSDGYMIVSDTYLKFGVRFPLHPFFVEVFEYFGLTLFQITPNGWTHMIGLFDLFAKHGMGPPTATKFAWFYSVKGIKNDEGFYYFAKRSAKGLQAITKIKESLGPWKESYFYTPKVHVKGIFGKASK